MPKIPKKILKIASLLGIKIEVHWKPKYETKNVYIFPPSETVKILHLDELPVTENEESVQGYVREDLEEIDASLLSPVEKHRDILKEMKDYLPLEYYSVLLQSCSVVKFEELGKNKKANQMLDSLRRRWGSLGAKIYNLVESSFFTVT